MATMSDAPNPVPADATQPSSSHPDLNAESTAVDSLRSAIAEARRVVTEVIDRVQSLGHLAVVKDVEGWLKAAEAHLGGAHDAASSVKAGQLAEPGQGPSDDVPAPSQGLAEPAGPGDAETVGERAEAEGNPDAAQTSPAGDIPPAPAGDEETPGDNEGDNDSDDQEQNPPA